MIQVLVSVDFVDVTDPENECRTGDLPWDVVRERSLGALFRTMRGRYGRCTGKVYRDEPSGDALEVGWVFRKRGDEWCGEDRVIDSWVTLSCDLKSARAILDGGQKDKAQNSVGPDLLRAVLHVLEASEDCGDFNDVDFSMLREVAAKAESAGVRVR